MNAQMGLKSLNLASSLNFYYLFVDTTDVQEATVMVNHENSSIDVMCVFAVGSRAMGCYLELIGEFGNYSVYIPRENDSAIHQDKLMQHPGRSTYSIYDWEEDGSIGNVSAARGKVV